MPPVSVHHRRRLSVRSRKPRRRWPEKERLDGIERLAGSLDRLYGPPPSARIVPAFRSLPLSQQARPARPPAQSVRRPPVLSPPQRPTAIFPADLLTVMKVSPPPARRGITSHQQSGFRLFRARSRYKQALSDPREAVKIIWTRSFKKWSAVDLIGDSFHRGSRFGTAPQDNRKELEMLRKLSPTQGIVWQVAVMN